MNAQVQAEAVIVGAEIGAGHDGAAELVLTLRYENGATAPVVLDAETGFSLMRNCGAESLADLAGQSWRNLLEGLE
ncbi:MAG: hypothetical protein P4L73_08470 [Caulobacteraceae bacterium]|nr:hypothetical protein [Caulobacteraceae bacterium]